MARTIAELPRRNKRTRLSPRDVSEIFRRRSAGESLPEIARSLGRFTPHLHQVLRRYGGIAPLERKRSDRFLSALEREEISRGLVANESIRSIARRLGRSPSTVSRELKRNGGVARYRAAAADQHALRNARRPRVCKLRSSPRLARLVAQKLRRNWSPQQISGWLRVEYPNNREMRVSAETIYRTLFVQARGALKKELLRHLRLSKGMRGPKVSRKQEGKIPDAISIRDRPAEVEDRAVPGHWEGDLIAGRRNQSFIGTLVERQTRFVKLVKVDSKDADGFAEALKREVVRLPVELRRSLTWDRGTEMARHRAFSFATDVAVYFCDPHSPWQRGSNENTNGLLRQYFPKGMVLSGFTQDELDAVARELNERPRMTLGWKTPAQKLNELVATTG